MTTGSNHRSLPTIIIVVANDTARQNAARKLQPQTDKNDINNNKTETTVKPLDKKNKFAAKVNTNNIVVIIVIV